MNISSLIVILINFSFLIPQQTNMEKEAVAVFGFANHLNSAGQPSKFDGDYYSYTLFLYDDKSFVYKFQNGRLKPRFEKELGIWEILGKKLDYLRKRAAIH